ncbi:MAG: hypothetical protein QUS14_02615, partial [Pyrinomonadaceae bacterium]|nr:hypothetical protein [Pyrinomonadaceae bacterium]
MKEFISAVMVFLAAANMFGLSAQTRRAVKAVKPVAAEQNTAYGLASEETSPVLSEPWNRGELPAALAVKNGDGDADAAIAELAAKILAGNAESTPALLAALQQAGFFITNK